MNKIVAFSGRAGSGKSAAAKILVDSHDYQLHKLATPIKNMLRGIGLREPELEGSEKQKPCNILNGKTPRFAMQTIGVEWGRERFGDDFWVNLWETSIPSGVDVVVDDVRFDNELKRINEIGGTSVLVVRKSNSIRMEHSSETGIEENKFDHIIYNDGSLPDLERKVEEMMDGFFQHV